MIFYRLPFARLNLQGINVWFFRLAWSDKKRYIRDKGLASSLMAFTIRNWLFLADTCVIARKWQLKAWSKWRKISWAIKFLPNAFCWSTIKARDFVDRHVSHCPVYCKSTLGLLNNWKKSSWAATMRKLFCFKYWTHLAQYWKGKTKLKSPVEIKMAMAVLVWILCQFKRNYFNLLWTLKVLTASLMILLKMKVRKSFLIQGKDCTKSWRQASKRLINYLITYFPIFCLL